MILQPQSSSESQSIQPSNRHLISLRNISKLCPSELSQYITPTPILMPIDQRYYLLSPHLYSSFRNQILIQQIQGSSFKLMRYSGGRKQMIFENAVEVELSCGVSLTVWNNGDYKLVNQEQVCFWHQEVKLLDTYCIAP